MKNPAPPARPKWQRLFLVGFIAVTLGVAAISVWTNLSRWNAKPNAAAAATGLEPLEIVSSDKSYKFSVEVMRTDTERAKGLMFRQSMPSEHGMLFDFVTDTPVAMWMKNTYISLDMLFIRADGVIHRIERRTEPHSERTIPAGAPVRAVLEINGGLSDKLGLKPGDRISHPMFPAK